MRYFAQKSGFWLTGEEYLVYEVTNKYALELYKGLSNAGQYNLVAVPNHKKGTLVVGKAFRVWGEIITPEECFNRRLKGNLANKVLNKRIADE